MASCIDALRCRWTGIGGKPSLVKVKDDESRKPDTDPGVTFPELPSVNKRDKC